MEQRYETAIRYASKERYREIYALWQEIFADTESFAQYYFEHIYLGNQVLVAEADNEICSMLHLNPYQWYFANQKEEIQLHYIVGVATKPQYRRQGLMADCMRQALRDRMMAEEPFTYLMPAKREYYTPFGFTALTGERIWEKKQAGADWYLCKGYPQEKETGLFDTFYRMLNYPIRTRQYMEGLKAEVLCDEGNIRRLETVNGYVAYVLDRTKKEPAVIITQLFCPDGELTGEQLRGILEGELCPFLYEQYGEMKIHYAESRDMMLRILNLKRLLPLLSYRGADKVYTVQVTDEICEANQGVFRIILSKQGCRAERLIKAEGEAEQLHISELTLKLLQDTDFADSLYLMETV